MRSSEPIGGLDRGQRHVDRGSTILVSIHGSGRGGAELLGIETVKALSETFVVVAATPRPDLVPEAEATVPGPRSMPLWGASATIWLKRCAATVIDAWRLSRTIRRYDVRLVLTNSSVSLSPVLAGRLCNVPCIVHVRDWPASRLSTPIFWLHAALASQLILICRTMEPLFPQWLPARRAVIYEGVDVDVPPQSSEPRDAAVVPLRLLLVGGIDHRKGQDIAVRAVDLLRRRGVDARLRLVGRDVNARFAGEVRALVGELGLERSVTFEGEVTSMGAIYCEADAVIVPSRGEWTPLVIMEALVRGLPVIASDVGGVAEMLEAGRLGLLTRVDDPADLAEAIARVAAGGQDVAAMCRAGREEARVKFDHERSLRELTSLVMKRLATTS
jgi:glycosyltransferase involved in cell wall biosynthesis